MDENGGAPDGIVALEAEEVRESRRIVWRSGEGYVGFGHGHGHRQRHLP